jgi:hypothetical protein
VEFRDDPGLTAVLRALGLPPGAALGQGGEARVFALGDDRIVRVLHAGGRADDIVRRQRLVDELARARPPYALRVGPDVIATARRTAGRARP